MAKRDIYKRITDKDFNKMRDIDLVDMRSLMKKERTKEESDRLALYIYIISCIILKNKCFIGYEDSVKYDIQSLGFIQAYENADKFKSDEYTANTAPFSYIYRIIYNKATKILKAYYKQRYVPESSIAKDLFNTISKSYEDEKEEPSLYSMAQCMNSSVLRKRRKFMKVKLKHYDQLRLQLI